LQDGLLVDSVQPTALVTAFEEAFPPRVDYDLLLLATKAYDVSSILKQMPGSKFSLPRKVMTIQNGVGAEETVKKLLGARHVLAASLTVPVSVVSAGSVVVERLDCGLGLAPMAIGERVDEWVKMFTMAGIKTVAYRDYRAMKWSKLLLNIVANATCAILNRQPGVIYRYRPTFELERAMLKETLAVMKRMGVSVVDLPGTPARLLPPIINYLPGFLAKMVLEPQIRNGRGDKMPSLQLDLAAGRKQSEVIFMNGAVAREGRRLGVPTPVNFLLADTLHKLFQKVLLWDDFRGKPDALLALLRRR
jgi:2-dehydropantoate 2-reductase